MGLGEMQDLQCLLNLQIWERKVIAGSYRTLFSDSLPSMRSIIFPVITSYLSLHPLASLCIPQPPSSSPSPYHILTYTSSSHPSSLIKIIPCCIFTFEIDSILFASRDLFEPSGLCALYQFAQRHNCILYENACKSLNCITPQASHSNKNH